MKFERALMSRSKLPKPELNPVEVQILSVFLAELRSKLSMFEGIARAEGLGVTLIAIVAEGKRADLLRPQ